MNDHNRYDDDLITRKVKLFLDLFNRVGFPVIVCIWLGYQEVQLQNRERMRDQVLIEFKEVLNSLKASVDINNRLLRHKRDE